jgi:small subunit ribosomal protein S9
MPTKTKSKKQQYYQAIGRRKTAVASVRIQAGEGKILVNKEEPSQYFEHSEEALKIFLEPFKVCGEEAGKFDISIKVKGGGKKAQIEAIRLGIARALILINPEFRTTLKKMGFLTRDPRQKERKKPGLKRARRAPQWSKR